jgi:hypothetical protein
MKSIKLIIIFSLLIIYTYGQTGTQAIKPEEKQLQKSQTTKIWQCGKDLMATLEGSTLTITGEGKMGNFGPWGENTPWEHYRNSIKEIKLKGVTSIAAWAFANCKNLTSITIPRSVTSIGSHAFSDCKSLTSIIIPSSVTTIGAGAFSHCISLTSIKLHYNLITIGEFAFGNCSALPSIVIPGSVTDIVDSPFPFCRALSSITVYCEHPPRFKGKTILDEHANFSKCVLYVPRRSMEAYKKADGWKDFTDIREIQQ